VFVLATGLLLAGQLGAANEFYGDFQGSALLVDTRVESPATYDNSSSTASPRAGETIEFQLFVPLAAGKQTLGYNLEFSARGFDFLEFFSIFGRDFSGSPIVITQNEPVATAILISRPTYPSSGYIGTITLTALRDVPPGTQVFLTGRTALADVNSAEDLLDVSEAIVDLVEEDFVEAIPGDLDLNGSVDFSDFLVFAANFGRSGPPPTPPRPLTVFLRDTLTVIQIDTVLSSLGADTIVVTLWDTVAVTIRDTITLRSTITVRDTVQVIRTVRDTIFLTGGTPEDPARALLGYWRFDEIIGGTEYSDEYHLDEINNVNGESVVTGIHKRGGGVSAAYSADLGGYVLADHTSLFYYQDFFFQIVGDRIEGVLFFYLPSQTLNDASTYTLLSSSGRISGFSASKITLLNDQSKTAEQRAAGGTQTSVTGDMTKLMSAEVERLLQATSNTGL
jgi:hypothetical protein